MSGRDPNNPNDPNDNIVELRRELKRHEMKIKELEQQVQDLKNHHSCSTKKIQELEEDKKVLEREVNELKQKIKWLEDEVRYFSGKPVITDLKKELKEKDDRMDSMEKSFEQKLNAIINRMEKKDKRLDMVEKDLRYFDTKCQDQEKDLKKYMVKTDELEKSRNILYIGQLCAKLMEGIYREVLPVYFANNPDNYKQPHLNCIDKKIEELCHNKINEKREAQRKWRKFQAEKIDADPNKVKELIDFMEEMLADRNEMAHPFAFNEEELKNIASELPGQKQLLLQKVIEISKKMFPTLFVAF